MREMYGPYLSYLFSLLNKSSEAEGIWGEERNNSCKLNNHSELTLSIENKLKGKNHQKITQGN